MGSENQVEGTGNQESLFFGALSNARPSRLG